MAGTIADILYDPEDEHIVSSRKWYVSDTGYAVWRGYVDGKKQTLRLHRLIIGAKPGEIVDHLNRKKLDNRRSNLKICTRVENARNRTSKGYCYDKSKNKFMVRYNKRFYGRYDTEQEAIEAVKKARSGVEKHSKIHPRRKYLPEGIQYMQHNNNKYYIRPIINGERVFGGYFSTVAEAKAAYNLMTATGGLTSYQARKQAVRQQQQRTS